MLQGAEAPTLRSGRSVWIAFPLTQAPVAVCAGVVFVARRKVIRLLPYSSSNRLILRPTEYRAGGPLDVDDFFTSRNDGWRKPNYAEI
jgi:hypothetical protein